MKCIYFLLLALLTALVLADSSVESTASSDLTSSLIPQPSAEVDPSTATSLDDEDTREEDIFSGDPELKAWFDQLNEATRRNDTWRSENYPKVAAADESLSNITAADTPSFDVVTAADKKRGGPNLKGYYRVDVRLGRVPTHTGTLRGKRMFNRMYRALKDCGIAHHNPSIPGFCNKDRPECPEHCDIPNVVYDKGGLNYGSDSSLKLVVKFSWFDITHHQQIRDLGFRIVARIYELMTLQSSNCRYTNFPNSRSTLMCSVASKVELAFPINGGLIQGVLNVELIWSKHTKEGSYTCEGDTEGNVDAMMWTDYRSRISNAMSWPEKQILPFVYCTDPDCFNQNLKLDEPWHENKGCVPLDWPLGCDPSLTGPSNPKLNCPPSAEPKQPSGPPRRSKALSIIYQDLVTSNSVVKSWLFFAGDFGKSSACRKSREAIKKVDGISGDATNPPWPGGTYTLNNLHGMECDYKNDGTNAGALWCKEGASAGKNKKIQCEEEATKRVKKFEICPADHGYVMHHRVVKCEW